MKKGIGKPLDYLLGDFQEDVIIPHVSKLARRKANPPLVNIERPVLGPHKQSPHILRWKRFIIEHPEEYKYKLGLTKKLLTFLRKNYQSDPELNQNPLIRRLNDLWRNMNYNVYIIALDAIPTSLTLTLSDWPSWGADAGKFISTPWRMAEMKRHWREGKRGENWKIVKWVRARAAKISDVLEPLGKYDLTPGAHGTVAVGAEIMEAAPGVGNFPNHAIEVFESWFNRDQRVFREGIAQLLKIYRRKQRSSKSQI